MSRPARGSRAMRVIRRQAASARTANGIVESGQRRNGAATAGRRAVVRPVPRPASARGRAAGLARRRHRRPASRPGPARALRPGRTTTGPPRRSAPNRAIGIAARSVGSGSQTSKASRGNASGEASGSSTARPRRVRDPRAGCERRRRSRPCPPASGTRSGRRRMHGPGARRRRSRRPTVTASRRVTAPPALGRSRSPSDDRIQGSGHPASRVATRRGSGQRRAPRHRDQGPASGCRTRGRPP